MKRIVFLAAIFFSITTNAQNGIIAIWASGRVSCNDKFIQMPQSILMLPCNGLLNISARDTTVYTKEQIEIFIKH